jgi:hypothetical protein
MKYTLLLLAIMLIAGRAFAQFGGNTGVGSVWHFPGQYGVEGDIGRTPLGFVYRASFAQYTQSDSYYKASLSYEAGNFNQVNFNTYGASLIYFYSPYSIQQTVFFNVGIGAVVDYDKVTNFWPAQKSQLNPGGIGGVEVEAAVSDYMMLTGSALQRVLYNNDLGGRRFEIELGIKYLIN